MNAEDDKRMLGQSQNKNKNTERGRTKSIFCVMLHYINVSPDRFPS